MIPLAAGVPATPAGQGPSSRRRLWLGAGVAALLLLVLFAAWPRKHRGGRNGAGEGPTESDSGERRYEATAVDRRFRETWVPHPVPIAGLKGWCIETNDVGAAHPDAFDQGEDGQLQIHYAGQGWSKFDASTCGLLRGPFDQQYAAVARDQRTAGRVVAGGVQLWDVGSSLPRLTLRSGGPRYTVSFSPDGKTVVTGDANDNLDSNQFLFWDRKTGDVLAEVKLPEPLNANVLAWSADSKSLAAPSKSNRIALFRAPWTAAPKTLNRPGLVSWIDWSPKGALLATIEDEGQIHLIDVEKGQDTVNLPKLQVSPRCLAWSPDGKSLGVGTTDRRLQVWDREKEKLSFTFTGHKRELTCVAFLGDGVTMVSGSKGGVRFWDLEKNRLRGNLLQLAGGAWLAIAPEGHYRCSPGGEGRFVYKVRQDDNELRDLPPDEFRKRYGWKNDPEGVKLVGK